ncbi:MAG: hypothetical protein Q7Q71_09740 [Verrucomicrobiota bacterium JB023]|nr:hypothetical protein [Verrucomicrobiota bacterium JB023]
MTKQNLLHDAVQYPFKGNGKYVLLWGALLGVATDLASLAGPLAFFALLVLSAYFCATFFEILVTSATGSSEEPGFPNLADIVDDIIYPYLKVVSCILVSFAPSFIYGWSVGSGDGSPVISLVLLLLGAVYLPMAILAVGILDSFTAMLPQTVLPAIPRAGGLYWVIVAILFAVTMVTNFVDAVLGDVFVIGSLVMAAVSMLGLMINGRLLGLLYREKADELDWI